MGCGAAVGARGGCGTAPRLLPEKPRTFSERERKFTIKFFTLQFFVHFSSLIYIAFILGRWATTPHPSNLPLPP